MEKEERAEVEALEIEDLEYEVGGVGAVEPNDTMANHGANFIIRFR